MKMESSENNVTVLRDGLIFGIKDGSLDKAAIKIVDDKIAAIGNDALGSGQEVDCSGLIVCPGLVDLHTHLYKHSTTLGVDPDHTCLGRGVTTAVDGGSAGAMTYQGLQKYIVEKSETRVLAFLHIACHGLAGAGCSGPEFGPGGESDHLNALKTNLCVNTIKENKEVIVGVKVRLDKNITDDGRNEAEALKRAISAGNVAGVPVMIHHTMSSLSLEEVLGSMRPGDIYTHTYSAWAGQGGSIVDRQARTVNHRVFKARDRGVIFDVGHGQGSFDWEVAEICASCGFYPDTISTDLHSGNVDGAAKDLPWVMSKFLHLGLKSL